MSPTVVSLRSKADEDRVGLEMCWVPCRLRSFKGRAKGPIPHTFLDATNDNMSVTLASR